MGRHAANIGVFYSYTGKRRRSAMELRDKLNRLKSENGLTTDALSERSGVPKGTLNKLLNGEDAQSHGADAEALARALGCPLETLCGTPADIPACNRLGDLGGDVRRLIERGELLPVTARKVPLLGEIAAGQPITCVEEGDGRRMRRRRALRLCPARARRQHGRRAHPRRRRGVRAPAGRRRRRSDRRGGDRRSGDAQARLSHPARRAAAQREPQVTRR